MLKSTQTVQVTNAAVNPLDVAITAVDPAYTRISAIAGQQFNNESFRIALMSATNVRFTNFTNSSGNPDFNVNVKLLVEEYLPFFFRQAFHYGVVTLGSGVVSNSVNTGLTFGPKALLVSLGIDFDFPLPTPYFRSAQLSLSGGIVTALRPIPHTNTGNLNLGFLIMDPK